MNTANAESMKLTQKRFPFGQFDFELTDDHVKISTKKMWGGSEFEVPLKELRIAPSTYRAFPILWLLFAVFSGLVTLLLVYGLTQNLVGVDKGGMALAACIIFSGFCGSLYGFFQRKVDFIIFHSQSSGQPLVYFHRHIPSERHVSEFVEITRERIEQSQLR